MSHVDGEILLPLERPCNAGQPQQRKGKQLYKHMDLYIAFDTRLLCQGGLCGLFALDMAPTCITEYKRHNEPSSRPWQRPANFESASFSRIGLSGPSGTRARQNNGDSGPSILGASTAFSSHHTSLGSVEEQS